MKKILGLIFSLVGNIGIVIVFLLNAFLILLNLQAEEFSLTLPIILSVVTIVLYILATIGNKFEDEEEGSGIKTKYVFMKIAGLILGSVIMTLICVAGLIVAIFGVANIFMEMVSGLNNTAVIFFGAFVFVGGIFVKTVYSYAEFHCAHCGLNLKGCDWEYEEYEREYSVGNDEKVRSKSRVKFIFTCENCGHDNVRHKTMNTDGEQIDNYARTIAGDN